MRLAWAFVMMALGGVSATQAGDLIEPSLRLPGKSLDAPHIAVTLDACMGKTDLRILNTLVDERIPATLFVTRRWLDGNPDAVRLLAAHADLFDIEDHGRDHVPAVTGSEKPYGIKPAGTLEAVDAEVLGGADAITATFGTQAHWFRGATALYTQDALDEIGRLGFRIAGFSLNADFGASVSARSARKNVDNARDGDVIIAHINQPNRASGEGIAEGLRDLKAKGVTFVRLDAIQ